ncbi:MULTISPECIES: SOS response-associated peptidase family protein [Brevibacillus]|uniref:SOS response-associated peptidase family protein n=1 Tax=Brevibacillus TaxID=55080 RepID=UPI0028528FBF|nr:SOS response-associated peptidase family protein [Brevibacillus laterosporus]
MNLNPDIILLHLHNIAAIISNKGKKRIGQLKWGLIPSWAKDEKTSYKMINAKTETIREKPSFKNLIIKKRCLIPADGFYEWKRIESDKQPMRIMMLYDYNLKEVTTYSTFVICLFFLLKNSLSKLKIYRIYS